MIKWYEVYNKATFEETGLVSRKVTLDLEDIGETDVLITQGNTVGLTVLGQFLALELNGKNPFRMGDLLAYVDDDDLIWLGVWVED